MSFVRLIILSIVLIIVTPFSVSAAWVEAKSENFVFVGNVSETKAHKIVSELEEYRLVLLQIMGLEGQAETIPVKIYAAKSARSIEDITGNPGLSSPAHQIAYHELTHHIVSTYSNKIFPRWYNEGYAEYLSTFEVKPNGTVHLGLPSQIRGSALANIKWFSMDDLLKSVRFYPYKNDNRRTTAKSRAIFYAQSWLAVHFISSTKGYPEKMRAYLKGLNSHDIPPDLFEKSFGMSPESFGELLKKYFKKNSYNYLTMNFEEGFDIPEIVSRKLTKGEAEFQEAGGPVEQVSASKAQIATEAGEHENALADINKALEIDPNDSRILQIAGLVHLNMYADNATSQTEATLKKSRVFFKKSMRANPQNMMAHYNYVSTYVVANDEPSKQALYSADECAYYYRDRNFIDSNMHLAQIMLKSSSPETARPVLEKARVWSLSSQTRSYALQALRKLN